MARFPQAKPVNIEDFSGGITDQIITNDVTRAEEMDNLVITDNRKAKGRDGSDTLGVGATLVPAAAADPVGAPDVIGAGTARRIGGIREFKENSTLIVQSGRKVYANDGTDWTELLGPDGSTDGLPQATDELSANLSASEWRGHLFMTNDNDAQPAKVYKDENGALKLLGAGLPEVADDDNFTSVATTLVEAINLANDIASKYNTHVRLTADNKHDTGLGVGDDITSPSISTSSTLSQLETFIEEIKSKWVTLHIADMINTIPTKHFDQDRAAADGTFPQITQIFATLPAGVSDQVRLNEAVGQLLAIKRDLNLHDNNQAKGTLATHFTQDKVHLSEKTNPVTTKASLLDAAVAMANEIRDRLINHLGESTNLHTIADSVSSALITSPLITSEVDATKLSELKVLTGQLLEAFSNHVGDVSFPRSIHGNFPFATGVDADQIFKSLAVDTTLLFNDAPTTLEEACNSLDDLKLRFEVHDVDAFVHTKSASNNRSKVAINSIGHQFLRASSGPVVAKSLQAVINYAQTLKQLFTNHIENTLVTGAHTNVDSDNIPELQTPVDELSLSNYVEDMILKFTAVSANLFKGHVETQTNDSTLVVHAVTPVGNFSDQRLAPDVGTTVFSRYHGGIVPGNYTRIVARLNEFRDKLVLHLEDSAAHSGKVSPNYLTIDTLVLGTYSYAFHYFREYKVGSDVTFQDFGPVLTKTFTDVADPKFSPNVIKNIPALSAGVRDNLDSVNVSEYDNIKLRIYRTVANGNTFYKVAELAAQTVETNFTDRVDDDTLILQETLYTTGGILSNDRPPESKYLHIVNEYCYYGNVTLNGEGENGENVAIPHRILQSKVADPDSTPRGNFVDLDEPVVGISSYGDRPIAFTASSVYRLDGTFDEAGNGFIEAVKIADDVGLASNRSLVRVDKGLLFAGAKDGFYITEGSTVRKISDFETRYRALNAKSDIVGVFDEKNRRVIWATKKESTSTDNDQFFVLHLNQPIQEGKSSFTTASGGASFSPSALGYLNDQVIRGNSNGYMFKHDIQFRTDPVIETDTAPTEWVDETIIWNYKHIATNFGMDNLRKWVPFMTVKTKRNSRLSLLPKSHNDLGTKVTALAPILVHGPEFIWRESDGSNYDFIWSDSDFIWDHQDGTIGTNKRRFSSPQIRCDNKQMQFTNANTLILSSDSSQEATINSTAKTLTLPASPSIPWPLEFEGYTVSFSVDGFVTEFPITAINPNQLELTYSDANNQTGQNYPASISTTWVVRGQPKGEILELLAFSIYYVPFSNSQLQYQGSPQGGSFDAQAS